MSAVRNAEAKRVTSIARAINWGYMWRRLVSYVWLDLLLLVITVAILVYGYNQTLPDSAFTAGWIPGATVRGMSLKPARGWDLTTLTYTVELARDYAISDVLFKAEDVLLPEVTCDAPGVGQYFVRVRATSSDGYTQDAFDCYVTDDGKQYSMKCFYVQDGGRIVEDTYEEG